MGCLFLLEALAGGEPGTYQLKAEVEVPGLGRDVVESRFVLVWRGLGNERMTSPYAYFFTMFLGGVLIFQTGG